MSSCPVVVSEKYFCAGVVGQVSIMFVTLEKIAQAEPKHADIVLLENYAAFQNRCLTFSLLV